MVQCRICGNAAQSRFFKVPEMMIGTKEEFSYFQCEACQCLQRAENPDDMSKWYPSAYYSFRLPVVSAQHPLMHFFKKLRLQYWLTQKGAFGVGRLLAVISKKPEFLNWMEKARLSPSSKILDVGSGAGQFLVELLRQGFTDLTGIDRHIPEELITPYGIRILKKELSEINDFPLFDFIMLNHSLEHMQDQIGALKKVHELLRPNQHILVRIPFVASYAWRTYGVHWVQLDAPRHCYCHSLKSFSIVAESTGFAIVDIIFDSTEFQFWGSEQYKAGIPLTDKRSYGVNPANSLFSDDQIAGYRAKARELNKSGQGDMACFILKAV